MGLVPQYICDMFAANNGNHSYNTRNVIQLRASITRTAYYYHSFTVSGLNLWNSLPNNIKECTSALREESSQTNVILQYRLLAAILSAVCSVI